MRRSEFLLLSYIKIKESVSTYKVMNYDLSTPYQLVCLQSLLLHRSVYISLKLQQSRKIQTFKAKVDSESFF